VARIVFHVWPETGHVNPVATIARDLIAAGHEVAWIGWKRSGEVVRRAGFPFVPLFERLGLNGLGEPELIWRRRLVQAYIDGTFSAALAKMQPDLVVADSLLAETLIAAHGAEIPYLSYSILLPNTADRKVPPLASRYAPDSSRLSSWIVRALWLKWICRRRLRAHGDAIRDRWGLAPCRVPETWIARLANANGLPTTALNKTSEFGTAFVASCLDVVLCPDAFDYPGRCDVSRRYSAASIDWKRTEVDFPHWDRLRADERLILCAFGSQSHRYEAIDRIKDAVVGAIGNQPGIQCILQDEREALKAKLEATYSNILVAPYLPQLKLLKRSALVITHGGLGTIKECIESAVPVIVFPQGWDQIGNMARVAHHGIGIAGVRTTKGAVGRYIRDALGNRLYRENIGVMRDKFMDAGRYPRAAEIIMAELSRGAARRSGVGG
jgi:UDP:flavonoid glycosyltransferase YjiC (YdhE family)